MILVGVCSDTIVTGGVTGGVTGDRWSSPMSDVLTHFRFSIKVFRVECHRVSPDEAHVTVIEISSRV